MRKFIQTLAIGLAVVLGASATASAADTTDPVIGTWTLNLSKSTYHDNRAPKSLTRTYAAGAGGTTMKVTGVAGDGTAISQSATLTYDGSDCAITGSPDFDSLALTKINGTTVKSQLKMSGKLVGKSTRTISGKGKVLTLKTSMKTAKGGTIHDTAVFDKQ